MKISIRVDDQHDPTIIDTGTDDVGESWDDVLRIMGVKELVQNRWYKDLLRPSDEGVLLGAKPATVFVADSYVSPTAHVIHVDIPNNEIHNGDLLRTQWGEVVRVSEVTWQEATRARLYIARAVGSTTATPLQKGEFLTLIGNVVP